MGSMKGQKGDQGEKGEQGREASATEVADGPHGGNGFLHEPQVTRSSATVAPKQMWEFTFFCDTQDKLDPLVIKVPEEILERQEYLGRTGRQGILDNQVGVDSMARATVKNPASLYFPQMLNCGIFLSF